MISNFDYKDLIVKFLTNTISSEEMGHLQQWIKQSETNRELFNNIKNTWVYSNQQPAKENFNPAHSFTKLKQKVNGVNKVSRFITLSRYFGKYAAVAVLFLVIGTIVGWFIKSPITFTAQNTIVSAPLGSRSKVVLPDGTEVWLNAGSYIEYTPEFGKDTRTVKLTGEAYFTVAKNRFKPFLVKSDKVTVKAIGTRFNVKAYPEEKTITTTLEEGKIEVTTPLEGSADLQKTLLKPNENIVYYKALEQIKTGKLIKEPAKTPVKAISRKPCTGIVVCKNIKTNLFTSWKDKNWVLEGEPLGALGVTMERRFNIVIVFNQPELKNYKFTGTIENETLEQILSAFKLTAPIDYKIKKDTVFFSLNHKYIEKYKRITEY